MDEYIERRLILERLQERDLCLCVSEADIKELPAADVAPVVHRRWIMDGKEHCYCSECKHGRNIRTQIGWAFCPNCGAKMDKEESEK